MASNADELLSVAQAAALMGVTGQAVRHWIHENHLHAQLLGNSYVIRRGDLDKIPEEARKPGRRKGIKPWNAGKAKAKGKKN
jgi:excisionase family DNA binding protein